MPLSGRKERCACAATISSQIGEARAAYQQGLEVATRTGDLQTRKEIEVFLRRLEKAAG
jgi:hypothetical protein